jgi:hypothetical protein
MTWLLLAGIVWVSVATLLAMLLGRSVRIADQLADSGASVTVPDFVPANWTTPAR